MLTRCLFVTSLLLAVAILTACAGQTPTATNTAVVPERPTPEAAPPSPTAAPVTPSAQTPEPPSGSAGPPSGDEGITSGGESLAQPPAPDQATPTDIVATATPDAVDSAADVAAINRIVEVYWDTINARDADAALSMLEENYRADQDERIRKDLRRMGLFRVKLDVSEEKPLALNEAGDYEIYLKLATPVDTRHVKMVFRKIGDQWWIVFSDEIE